MSAAKTRLLGALLGAAASGVARTSAAEGPGGYILPGFLVTPTAGHVSAIGWGGELSGMYYPSRYSELGVGAFAQAQSYVGDAPTHGRFAVGVQAGWILGAELGVALRRGAGIYGSTAGAQIGPYVSLGIVNLAFRLVVPFAHDRNESYGVEAGVSLSLKLPVPWGDPPPQIGIGHGRPLRVREVTRTAPLHRGKHW